MIERTLRSAELRRCFLVAVFHELRIVWPILSGLVGIQLALGFLFDLLDRWPFGNAAYFTFVTALAIGYGDLVPFLVLSLLIYRSRPSVCRRSGSPEAANPGNRVTQQDDAGVNGALCALPEHVPQHMNSGNALDSAIQIPIVSIGRPAPTYSDIAG